jgi:hypothetical protein
VVAFSYFVLLLLAVPVILIAVLGIVLAAAGGRARAAGLTLLTILGVLLVGGIGLMVLLMAYLAVPHVSESIELSQVARMEDEPDWIEIDRGSIRIAAPDETASAGVATDASAEPGVDEPAGADAAEESAPEVSAVGSEDSISNGDSAETVSPPGSRSVVRTVSGALLRAAVSESSEPSDASSEAPGDDSVDDAGGSSAGEGGGDGTETVTVATPATAGADSVAADYRPARPDRAEIAEIKRYLDETKSAAEAGLSSPGDVVPPERPPWVGAAAFTIDRVDYLPVTSGPYATRNECRRALDEVMEREVDQYVEGHRGQAGVAGYVDFDLAYIRAHLRHGGVYEETVQASFGPMIQQHALLEFGDGFRREIEGRWKQVRVTSRLKLVGLAAVAILAGLATIFAYLRLDTATRGYYSGRLQFAAGAVILGLVALGVLVARWIPWL